MLLGLKVFGQIHMAHSPEKTEELALSLPIRDPEEQGDEITWPLPPAKLRPPLASNCPTAKG